MTSSGAIARALRSAENPPPATYVIDARAQRRRRCRRRRPRCSGTAQLLDDPRDVVGLHAQPVPVVDRDDGRPAASAEALDRAERERAVLGGGSRRDAELALECLEYLLRARRARTRRWCRPRRASGRPARDSTGRRRTRSTGSTRASGRARRRPRGWRRAGASPRSPPAPAEARASRPKWGRGTASRASGPACSSSSIGVSHDGIERAACGDEVGDEEAPARSSRSPAAPRSSARGTSRATAVAPPSETR